ncbi:hypothetical protein C8R44DRAFT_732049 [Mycena epipterygia]|nr:hypothetical protein C8R44DRAFT_732049 [Mycena epipterygia]
MTGFPLGCHKSLVTRLGQIHRHEYRAKSLMLSYGVAIPRLVQGVHVLQREDVGHEARVSASSQAREHDHEDADMAPSHARWHAIGVDASNIEGLGFERGTYSVQAEDRKIGKKELNNRLILAGDPKVVKSTPKTLWYQQSDTAKEGIKITLQCGIVVTELHLKTGLDWACASKFKGTNEAEERLSSAGGDVFGSTPTIGRRVRNATLAVLSQFWDLPGCNRTLYPPPGITCAGHISGADPCSQTRHGQAAKHQPAKHQRPSPHPRVRCTLPSNDCAAKARTAEGCLHAHDCLPVHAAAHSSLPVLRASYDPAHAVLRASYVARPRSRRRRSSTPSTSTPRLAARDGVQSHSDVDTPVPVPRKRPPRFTRARTTARRCSPASRTSRYRDGCTVPPPIRVRKIHRPRTHPRRGKHRSILAPHAAHASPYIRAHAVPPRSHPASPLATPYLRVHRARWLPTVDSAYVNAPGMPPTCVHEAPRTMPHANMDADAAAAHTTPRPTTRAPRALRTSPRRNSPRCTTAPHAYHHRAAAAFSPASDSPPLNSLLQRPPPRISTPQPLLHLCAHHTRATALAPRAGHATGPASPRVNWIRTPRESQSLVRRCLPAPARLLAPHPPLAWHAPPWSHGPLCAYPAGAQNEMNR